MTAGAGFLARLGGRFGGPFGGGLDTMPRVRRRALAASAGWAVLVLAYAVGFLSVAAAGEGRGSLFLDAMFFLLALSVPVLLVWLAAWLAEELARQREVVAALAEVAGPLTGAIAATLEALERQTPATSPEAIHRVVQNAVIGARTDYSSPLDRLLAGQARVEVALQKLAFRRPLTEPPAEPTATTPAPPAPEPAPAPPPPAPEASPEPPAAAPAEPDAEPRAEPDAEPGLPLIAEPERPARPGWDDLVRALDFPRDADDAAGFRALKVALRHHGLAQMLQSAEDVLDLLSQQGVFVDELPMERVDAGAWRRFIGGGRGPDVTGLGGISDPRALDAARALMRSDSIFRDSALFFQRRFDSVLGEFARDADDDRLTELAGTRSGRAFMILARLSGSLD